jgi:recombination protein RecT
MGFKGYVQLAQRTGQYTSINVIEVHENQFVSFNTLTEEFNADFSVEGNGKIVGYAAYFKLVNGFEKTCYWTTEKVMAHGKRYSKTFTNGPWKTDFDAMAKKTVLKSTLSKWGILSIEMQQALKVDQSVIKDETGDEVQYVDHEEIKVNPEVERLKTLIENATTTDELEKYGQLIPEELNQMYQEKYMDLMPSEK